MKPVFKKKIAVSDRVAVASAGKYLGEIIVPEGKSRIGHSLQYFDQRCPFKAGHSD